MTKAEWDAIAEAWVTLGEMYGKPISVSVVTMMMSAIEDLPPAGIVAALYNWPKTTKLARHPFPSEVRELVQPTVSPDTLAQAAAARIFEAIGKFGWARGTEAKEYIGELGWTVVKRFGGWQMVCETVGVSYEKSAFLAHARAIAKAEGELAHAGRFDEAPALPAARADRLLEQTSRVNNLVHIKTVTGSEGR